MGRGKLLKTKIRERKAFVKADLQAKKEWEERKSNQQYNIKKLLIDFAKRIDPVKLLVIGTTTYLVYPILAASKDIVDLVVPSLWLPLPFMLADVAAKLMSYFVPQGEEPIEKGKIDPWILSLSILVAYIIVEHPEAVTGAVTNISSFAIGLLK